MAQKKSLIVILTITFLLLFCVGATAFNSQLFNKKEAVNATNVWGGDVANYFAGGAGTETEPYQIATASQLAYLAELVNDDVVDVYDNAYYVLTDSLDLNNLAWTPIGFNYISDLAESIGLGYITASNYYVKSSGATTFYSSSGSTAYYYCSGCGGTVSSSNLGCSCCTQSVACYYTSSQSSSQDYATTRVYGNHVTTISYGAHSLSTSTSPHTMGNHVSKLGSTSYHQCTKCSYRRYCGYFCSNSCAGKTPESGTYCSKKYYCSACHGSWTSMPSSNCSSNKTYTCSKCNGTWTSAPTTSCSKNFVGWRCTYCGALVSSTCYHTTTYYYCPQHGTGYRGSSGARHSSYSVSRAHNFFTNTYSYTNYYYTNKDNSSDVYTTTSSLSKGSGYYYSDLGTYAATGDTVYYNSKYWQIVNTGSLRRSYQNVLNSGFVGHFNGGGYTVSNIGSFNIPTNQGFHRYRAGLFGTNNGTISNLKVATNNSGISIAGSYADLNVGTLVGYNGASGTISRCSLNSGSVKGNNTTTNIGIMKLLGLSNTSSTIGGLVGYNAGTIISGASGGTATSTNSCHDSNVTATNYVDNFVGYNSGLMQNIITYKSNYSGSTDEDLLIYKTRDSNIGVRDNNAFSRNIYEIENWNTEPDGSGASYNLGQLYTLNNDLTLYAQWRYKCFDVNLSKNLSVANVGGGGSIEYGNPVSIHTDNSNGDDRFVFSHWEDAEGNMITDEQDYSLLVTKDLGLKAIYRFRYNHFEINHIAQLYWLADRVNGGFNFEGITFTLVNDINLDDVDRVWSTIGTGENLFAGTFNGNGFTISKSTTGNITLFNSANTGKVVNLDSVGHIIIGCTNTKSDSGLHNNSGNNGIDIKQGSNGGR